MSRILLAAKHLSQTQLDGIAHEQAIICKRLFAGHVMGSRPMKIKKNLFRMIIALFNIHSNYFSVLKKITSTGTFFKTLAYFSARFQNIKQMGFFADTIHRAICFAYFRILVFLPLGFGRNFSYFVFEKP